MNVYQWYRYTFEDGTVVIVRGMSANELLCEVRKHGKVINISREGKY